MESGATQAGRSLRQGKKVRSRCSAVYRRAHVEGQKLHQRLSERGLPAVPALPPSTK
jgi:hypothetical protein